ncbi:MAG: hypothetical protein MZW92_80290 [Comamonadaceae bacterium]|nr:hypothetical protein [Comamonadaceae bacterium]
MTDTGTHAPAAPCWHGVDAGEVARALATDPQQGLSAGEAARAPASRAAPNEICAGRSPPFAMADAARRSSPIS